MKRLQIIQFVAATIASLGLVFPTHLQAADFAKAPADGDAVQAPPIRDVSLGEQGTLSGQLVDSGGVGVPHTAVTVRSVVGPVAQTVTAQDGRFTVRGLSGGVYSVSAGDTSAVYRLWATGSSPPSANQNVLMVAGGSVARGQFYPGSYPPYSTPNFFNPRRYITNGQVVTIVGLTALAGGIVGIAVYNEHKSGS